MSEKDTRIALSTETRERLKERKRGGETYEEVIENLLDATPSTGLIPRGPRFRVTGEVYHDPPLDRTIGTGEKYARLRRGGGKIGYVGSDALDLLGIPPERIKNGACLPEDEIVTVQVDLY